MGPEEVKDTEFFAAFGMDGAKYDNGGPGHNMTAWAAAGNATGRPWLLESCNDGYPSLNPDGSLNCPYNMFRTGIDISPDWLSMVSNLMDANRYLHLSQPGCWAYPDMLEVGAPAAGIADHCPDAWRLSFAEAQAQFSAWCVVSSPLTLSFDLANATEYAAYWPIISNTEAIAINQAWAGEAGHLVAASADTWTGPIHHGAVCEVAYNGTLPLWTVWGKAQPGGGMAAMAVNTMKDGPAAFNITAAQLGFPPGTPLAARDVNAHADLPVMQDGVWAVNLGPKGYQFLLFTPAA